jgi:hypothetical protein
MWYSGRRARPDAAFVFKLACEGGMHDGLRQQIRSGGCDRLDARLFIVGDDRHRVDWLVFRRGGRLLDAAILEMKDLGDNVFYGG